VSGKPPDSWYLADLGLALVAVASKVQTLDMLKAELSLAVGIDEMGTYWLRSFLALIFIFRSKLVDGELHTRPFALRELFVTKKGVDQVDELKEEIKFAQQLQQLMGFSEKQLVYPSDIKAIVSDNNSTNNVVIRLLADEKRTEFEQKKQRLQAAPDTIEIDYWNSRWQPEKSPKIVRCTGHLSNLTQTAISEVSCFLCIYLLPFLRLFCSTFQSGRLATGQQREQSPNFL
jgi:hypothetical protein